MKLWADFLNDLRMQLPGCPDLYIEAQLKRQAIEFYIDTLAWRTPRVTIGSTVVGQNDYAMPAPPADTQAVELCAVYIADEEIDPQTFSGSDEDELGRTGDDPRYTLVDSTTLRLTPAPNRGGEVIKATVAYAPAETAAGIDDVLYVKHHRAIEALLLARLMSEKGRPWENLIEASRHADEANVLSLLYSTRAGRRRRVGLRVRKV